MWFIPAPTRAPAGQEKKRERDLRILHLELAERPEHPFTLFNLGMTYCHARITRRPWTICGAGLRDPGRGIALAEGLCASRLRPDAAGSA